MPEITLQIDGHVYGGWTQVRVMRSLETVADAFSLALTDTWAGESLPKPIRSGTPCDLALDGQRIITGYVDDVQPEYDANGHTIRVSGRSKAGDLVDCSIAGEAGKPLEWNNKDLLAIARALTGRFGIEVSSATDIGKPFRKQRLDPGQPIFEFLEQLARIRAVRFVSDPDGNLIITRAGDQRSPTALILGENIERASGEFSSRERFSDYIVLGQQTGFGWDGGGAEAAAHLRGKAQDDALVENKRYRPTVILAEGVVDTADCKRRAEWQRNTAFGRGQGVVYTVSGWTHADGSVWAPNSLAPVLDQWLGIDTEQLIVSVQLLLDEQGQRTELRVMPSEAFELLPLPEPKDKKKRGWQQ